MLLRGLGLENAPERPCIARNVAPATEDRVGGVIEEDELLSEVALGDRHLPRDATRRPVDHQGVPSAWLVRGKGNADSFHSCSHGAGRVMSREAAKKRFTLEDHAKATAGIE